MKVTTWKAKFLVGFHDCSITCSADGEMTVEWSPPLNRKLSKQELDQYREGRNALLEEFQRDTGKKILLIES